MNKNWTIHQLERKAENGFVVNVHWRLSITDGEYYADTYSVSSYTQSEEDYIPFEDLTKEIVVGWVEKLLGKEKIEKIILSLEEQIENQKNPPIKTGLPWQK